MEPHGQSPWYLCVHPWGEILSEPTTSLSRAKSREGRGASRRIDDARVSILPTRAYTFLRIQMTPNTNPDTDVSTTNIR